MTAHLTSSDFEAAGPAPYRIEVQGNVVELVLTEVRPIEGSSRAGGGFVLTFRGPRDRFLRQAIYRLRGRNLEADVFIVPIAVDETDCLYEAVFN